MLNQITPVEASAATAAQSPIAGSGAGAFMCEGTWSGSRASRKATSIALPRIRHAAVAGSQGYVQAGSASRAYPTSFAQVSHVLTGSAKTGSGLDVATQQLNQTRIPVIPGGLGPHPAREPDPV